MVEESGLRVVRFGGNELSFRPPIITKDCRYLICASGDSIKVFSTSTEECIHVLESHTGEVTSVVLNPTNHLQVYSSSADGTIRLWDYIDGILIKTFNVGCSIFSMYASEKHVGIIFISIGMACDTSENFQLVALDLPKVVDQEVDVSTLSAVLHDINTSPGATAFGREGEYIASVAGFCLSVYFFREQKTYRHTLKCKNIMGATNAFTCVACHPKDDCIATGHEDGKILLWRNFNQKKYSFSPQHWHHDSVISLCFTPEGRFLLSGGVESVLVQWHYEEVNKKNFLPRLGGAVYHVCVSPDGQMYSTSHSDNKINIIHCSLKVSSVIQGLVKGNICTDLMIDPRTKALVMNGRPGHLQFYSLQKDKLIYSLDTVQQEYIYESGLDQYEVTQAAFDVRGAWLATVESKDQIITDFDMSLKLWGYSEKNQSFELNTTIMAAHKDGITSMCFSPSTETTMLVTTAKDGHFKVWLLGQDSDTDKENVSWLCDYMGSYHGLQPTKCCFSGDGSLLAVSYEEVVTVWNTDTWELLTTLCQPPGHIRDLCFGRLSCSKYLLGTNTKNLLCWNLLTCSLEWSTPMDVSLLREDPMSENVAAFSLHSGNSDLFVFKPSEPRPLFTQKAVCRGTVLRCVFAPREEPLDSCDERFQWLNRSRLYFLTEQMELLTFNTRAEDEKILNSRKQLLVDDSVAVTPFYLLLSKHRQEEEKQNSVAAAHRPQPANASVAIKELLHTPAHVLPAASFLCSMFINSLLISNTGDREGKELSEKDEESEKEEDESEDERKTSGPWKSRTQGSVKEEPVQLTRAEKRELKEVQRTDFGWVTSLSIS